jgi:hypothetical protein
MRWGTILISAFVTYLVVSELPGLVRYIKLSSM